LSCFRTGSLVDPLILCPSGTLEGREKIVGNLQLAVGKKETKKRRKRVIVNGQLSMVNDQ
jgi:hypothetical protein